jgi:leader peptidase (prepilin peptidase)/N-methyltransferase
MDLGVVVAALVGLLVVGPVMNVLVERVPDRLPLRGPRPDREPAPVFDALVVPMQPYLARRGRGPGSVRLPVRWLAGEVLTATLFALAWAEYGDEPGVWPVLLLFATLVPATIIDLRVLRIPDRIVFPGLLATTVAVVAVAISEDASDSLVGALVGAITYFMALFIPHLVYPKGMGFGDVKLAILLGLVLGWLGWSDDFPVLGPVQLVIYGMIAGMLAGILFGVLLPMIRRGRAFPLGPGLALGTALVVLQASELRVS